MADLDSLFAENESLRGSCKAMGADMGKLTRERNSFRAKAEKLKVENEALRKRADRWEEVGRLIVSEMPLRLRPRVAGNAPGHCHEVPGVWDTDNGELAGRECAWCKVWATALELSKGPVHE